MYKYAKAEGVMVGDYRSLGVRTAEQDGNKKYLLCRSCEEHLGDSERYLSLVMSEDQRVLAGAGIERLETVVDGNETILYHGVRRDPIEAALVGILYKAHFDDAPPFHGLHLEPGTLQAIRERLLQGRALPTEILAMKFYSDIPGADERAMVLPCLSTVLDMPTFTLMAAGWEWSLSIDDGDRFRQTPFYQFRCPESGPLPVLVASLSAHRNFRKERGESTDTTEEADEDGTG